MQQPRLATECCAGIFFYFQCGFVAKGAIPEGCFKLWVSRAFEVIARPLHCLHQPNGNVIAFSLGCTWNMGKGSLFWKSTCPFCIFWVFWFIAIPLHQSNGMKFVLQEEFCMLFLQWAWNMWRGSHFQSQHVIFILFCSFGVVAIPLHQSNEWHCFYKRGLALFWG